MKYIELSKDQKGALRRMFKVSPPTIWAALNYGTHSDLAKRIRKAAIAKGGIVKNRIFTPDGFIPNCQTEYIHKDGAVVGIIQIFPNDVRVVFENDKRTAEILCSGEKIKEFTHVSMGNWSEIVFEAQSLSNTLNEE